MSILKPRTQVQVQAPVPSLVEQLGNKADQLRTVQDQKAATARLLSEQAAAASEASAIANRQAAAVEKALDIVSEAGVTL